MKPIIAIALRAAFVAMPHTDENDSPNGALLSQLFSRGVSGGLLRPPSVASFEDPGKHGAVRLKPGIAARTLRPLPFGNLRKLPWSGASGRSMTQP